MGEPQLDDPIARSRTHFTIMDMECGDCMNIQEVEVQEEYSHSTITWYAEWKCSACGLDREQEGWYTDADI